ncbi:MAG: thioesterase family protein [Chloroflexota bacterium]
MDTPFKFYTPLKVRFNETDLQGHVNFAQYYFYFDVSITEYLTAIGYDYQTVMVEQDGIDFMYVESHCNNKSSAKWPEILNIHARIGYMGNRSLRFEFQIIADKDARLIATGHIVAVTADKDTFELAPVPDSFRQAVIGYEGDVEMAKPA